MAIGVTVQHLSTFPAPGSELVNAVVVHPAPTGFDTINTAGFKVEGDVERKAYPDLFSYDSKGIYVYGFFDDYYNRIHIFPNPIDFEYVASPISRSFEVWNAYLTPNYLESVTPQNAGGLALSGGPTTHNFLGLEAQTYTVWADTIGPGVIDASYDLAFTGLAVRSELVKGTRVIVFPFQPNWVTPVNERLEWSTEVLEMRDGSEQRIRARQNPRQMLEFEFLVHHDDANLFSNLMFGWQGQAWGAPLWNQGQRLVTEFLIGEVTFPCNTEGYQVGGQLIFYGSTTNYEALTIKEITDTSIITNTATLKYWPAGTLMFPLRVSFIMGSPSVKKITGELSSGMIQFHGEQNLSVPSTWGNTYKGYPVLEIEPNRVNPVTETWDRRTVTLDYTVGQSTIFDKDGFSKVTRSAEYLAINRQKLNELRNVLNYAQGQWKPFWAPTFDSDLRLVQNTNSGGTTLIIQNTQYTHQLKLNSMRQHLRIHLRNGSILYRKVVGADDINTPEGTETLTLEIQIPTGFTPADVYMISYMPLSRLGSDVVELGSITMNVVNTTLPLKPVLVPA